MRSLLGDTHANLEKMTGFVDLAAEEGADIVCFPEMSLTGYSSEHGPGDVIGEDDPAVVTIGDLARDKGLVIVFGFMEENGGGLPYLTQMIASPDGTSMSYRKTHLGSREDGRFASGDALDVFKTDKAVLGLALCWEAHLPEVFTALREQGAELILVPHASNLGGMRRKEAWMRYLPARAWDNDAYIAACNAVGDTAKGSVFGGGSIVLDRKGGIISEDFDGTESMVVIGLDGFDRDDGPDDDMRDIRFFRRRRPELYRRTHGSG